MSRVDYSPLNPLKPLNCHLARPEQSTSQAALRLPTHRRHDTTIVCCFKLSCLWFIMWFTLMLTLSTHKWQGVTEPKGGAPILPGIGPKEDICFITYCWYPSCQPSWDQLLYNWPCSLKQLLYFKTSFNKFNRMLLYRLKYTTNFNLRTMHNGPKFTEHSSKNSNSKSNVDRRT
jgi:hypothetical protein